MLLKFGRRLVFLSALLLLVIGAAPSPQGDKIETVRLYTLDCGRADLKDMGMFSDTGEYDGKPGSIVVPCFLIRHPKGMLLWDTGLGDKLAENKNGVDQGDIHLSVTVTLAGQLKKLGLEPGDVTYLAFSHLHFDHTGNANLFSSATWILNRTELNWALGNPTPFGVDTGSFSAYKNAKTKMIEGDYDVFGDGTVRILATPGHTPGHQMLELQLKKSGVVLLSGDLYHLRENQPTRRVPGFNYNRAETLASMDRIERIMVNTKARLVVQHDLGDIKGMPILPAYLE